jgi:hypothetical protein
MFEKNKFVHPKVLNVLSLIQSPRTHSWGDLHGISLEWILGLIHWKEPLKNDNRIWGLGPRV